jgi:hypothetical protein
MVEEMGSEGLLGLRAEPLAQAERICNNLVEVVRVTEGGALFLEADPAWARAINAVLVERGVKVSELRPIPREEELLAA